MQRSSEEAFHRRIFGTALFHVLKTTRRASRRLVVLLWRGRGRGRGKGRGKGRGERQGEKERMDDRWRWKWTWKWREMEIRGLGKEKGGNLVDLASLLF